MFNVYTDGLISVNLDHSGIQEQRLRRLFKSIQSQGKGENMAGLKLMSF